MKHVSCAVCKGGGIPKVAPAMAKVKGTDANSEHEDPDWPQTYCGCVQVPSSLYACVSPRSSESQRRPDGLPDHLMGPGGHESVGC